MLLVIQGTGSSKVLEGAKLDVTPSTHELKTDARAPHPEHYDYRLNE
uniref:Uncharacterized protein n=1 Tax=Arundo donax TaxID=35708 RepID=A0A0A8Y3Q2_ARUDO